MTKKLTNKNGRVIGWLESRGHETLLRNRDGRLLGYYDARTDKTTNENGCLIGYGNLLAALLF
jgi:hypothetical protein